MLQTLVTYLLCIAVLCAVFAPLADLCERGDGMDR